MHLGAQGPRGGGGVTAVALEGRAMSSSKSICASAAASITSSMPSKHIPGPTPVLVLSHRGHSYSPWRSSPRG